jgi:hypothetical protein
MIFDMWWQCKWLSVDHLNGFSSSAVCTIRASPTNRRRMSAMPATIQIRVPAGSPISAPESPAPPSALPVRTAAKANRPLRQFDLNRARRRYWTRRAHRCHGLVWNLRHLNLQQTLPIQPPPGEHQVGIWLHTPARSARPTRLVPNSLPRFCI